MMLLAALSLLLTAEPELRPRAVVEKELAELRSARPGPWGFIPGGLSIAYGLFAAFAGAHSNYHCTGELVSFSFTQSRSTLDCHHGPLVPWGQAAIGLGLTTAVLGAVGMIVLGVVRRNLAARIEPLERDLQLIGNEELLRRLELQQAPAPVVPAQPPDPVMDLR